MRRGATAMACLLLIAGIGAAQSADELLATGKKAFSDSLFPIAERMFQRIIDEHSDYGKIDEAWYLLAVTQFNSAAYEKSLSTLGTLKARYPGSTLASKTDYWVGASHFRLSRYQQALEYLVRAAEQASFPHHAMLLSGVSYEQVGRDADAAATYRRILSGSAPAALLPEATFRLASVEYRGGKFASARDLYLKVLLNHPESPFVRDSIFFLAESEVALKNPAEAEKRYRTLLAIYPDSPYRDISTYRLGEILALAGKGAEALALMDSYLAQTGQGGRSTPYTGSALRFKGDILFDQKKYEEALSAFSQALSYLKDPAEVQGAQYSVGLSLLFLGRKTEAQARFAEARRGPSRDIGEKAAFQHAALTAEMGDGEAAIQSLERFLADFGSSSRTEDALRILGSLYEKKGDTASALKSWDRLVKQFPRSPSLAMYVYQRGFALLALGEHVRALDDLQRLIKEYPQSPQRGESSYSVGYIYSLKGEFARAVPFFQTAYESAPTGELGERSLYSIAMSWFNLGNFPNALESFEKLRKARPRTIDDGTIALMLGRTLYRTEKLEQAVDRLKEASALLGGKAAAADALYWLGWSQFRLNRLKDARDTFSGAAQRFPADPRAAEFLLRAGICETLAANDASAVQYFDKALAVASIPADIREQALYERGSALFKQGRLPESDEAFARLAREFPGSRLAAEAFFARALNALDDRRYEEASAGFRQVARDFPRSSVAEQASYWAAEAVRLSGSPVEAAGAFWSYISGFPRGALLQSALDGYGQSVEAADSVDLARGYVVKAQAVRGLPTEILIHLQLDLARILLPRSPSDALTVLNALKTKALVEPLSGELNLLFGLHAGAAGDWERALSIFTVLATTRADRIGAEAKLGQAGALEATGSTLEAVDEFTRVHYLFPDFPDLASRGLYEAARVAALRGERDKARGLEDTLRREYPDSPWAKKLNTAR